MRFLFLVLLCAVVYGAPLGSEVEEAIPEEGEFQLPEAFIEESGPYVPPPAGWEGADACARRSENVVVHAWKKVKKKIKTCEVKIKTKKDRLKWNLTKGFCRGALRFCNLYKKFAKKYNSPALLFAAKPHCRKAKKLHAKLWKAARKAARKARSAKRKKLRACMRSKRCRRAHYKRMRRAEHGFPPVSVGKWRSFVAKHKKCMKTPNCRKKYLHRRAMSFRNGHRAARRCEYVRCMKNKTCRRRYRRFKSGNRARKKARKGKKAPKAPKGKKAGKGKAKGKAKGKKAKGKKAKGKKAKGKKAKGKKGAKKGAKKAADFVATNMFNF